MATLFFIFISILVGSTSSFYLDIHCERPAIHELLGFRNLNSVLTKKTSDLVCGMVEISEAEYSVPNMGEPKLIGMLAVKRFPPSKEEISFDVLSTHRNVFLMTEENNVSRTFGSIKVCEEDILIIEIPKWDEIHVYNKREERNHSLNIKGKIEALARLSGAQIQTIEADSSCINSGDWIQIELVTLSPDEVEIN